MKFSREGPTRVPTVALNFSIFLAEVALSNLIMITELVSGG